MLYEPFHLAIIILHDLCTFLSETKCAFPMPRRFQLHCTTSFRSHPRLHFYLPNMHSLRPRAIGSVPRTRKKTVNIMHVCSLGRFRIDCRSLSFGADQSRGGRSETLPPSNATILVNSPPHACGAIGISPSVSKGRHNKPNIGILNGH